MAKRLDDFKKPVDSLSPWSCCLMPRHQAFTEEFQEPTQTMFPTVGRDMLRQWVDRSFCGPSTLIDSGSDNKLKCLRGNGIPGTQHHGGR